MILRSFKLHNKVTRLPVISTTTTTAVNLQHTLLKFPPRRSAEEFINAGANTDRCCIYKYIYTIQSAHVCTVCQQHALQTEEEAIESLNWAIASAGKVRVPSLHKSKGQKRKFYDLFSLWREHASLYRHSARPPTADDSERKA